MYLSSSPGNRDGGGASGTIRAWPEITTTSPPPGVELKFSDTLSLTAMCRSFAPPFTL